MLKVLNKKIIKTTTVKQKIINTLIGTITWSIVIYMCLTTYNEDIVNALNGIKEADIALQISFILFPLIAIVLILLTIGDIIIFEHDIEKL